MRRHRSLSAVFCVLLTILVSALSRAAPGALDVTFGNGGKVITDLQNGTADRGRSVAVQSDGKILVAGGSNDRLVLARFSATGGLDPAFGEEGKVTVNSLSLTGAGRDIVVQSDGRIITLGYNATNRTFDLVRFTSTGVLDNSFGSAGRSSAGGFGTGTGYNGFSGMILQGDGKILVFGYQRSWGRTYMVLRRFAANGGPDSTFGYSGAVSTTDIEAIANGAALQEDGSIIVTGTSYTTDGSTHLALLRRFTPNGSLDTTFGTLRRGQSFTGWGSAVAVQSDGKILVAGDNFSTGPNSLMLLRYTSAGVLDDTFRTGGKLITTIGDGTIGGLNLALQSDGKIIVTGEYYTGAPDQPQVSGITAARLTADGAPDLSYGSGGRTIVPIVDSDTSHSRRAALQSDGKLLLAGSASAARSTDFKLTRLTNDGQLDPAFGQAGAITASFNAASSDAARGLLVLPDGKLLVAGWTALSDPDELDLVLVRYLPGGAVDTDFGSNGRLQVPLNGLGKNDMGLALQPDGKIVVAVNVWTGNAYQLQLVRCLTVGALDTAFGADGILTTPISCEASEDDDIAACVAVQSDGKVIAGGTHWNWNGISIRYEQTLVRYSDPGTLDASFGTGGIALSPATSESRCMALQPDGKILVASYSCLVRYTAQGALDTAFGSGGITAGFGIAYPRSVAVLSDGKILVSGTTGGGDPRQSFQIIRYTPAGVKDPSFSGILPYLNFGPFDEYNVRGGYLAVQNDGGFIVSGRTWDSYLASLVTLRCTPSGDLDPNFGTNGVVFTPVGVRGTESRAVAVQSDGKIIVAGTAFNGSDDLALVRYDPGPPVAQFTIGPVTNVTGASVTLNASVNPVGTPATAQFRYGLSSNYSGGTVPLTLSPVDGTLPQSVTAALSGLNADTLYHWQITATNGGGLSTSGDFTFRTLNVRQNWRLQWFGSIEDTGPGADSADPDHDGLVNFLEFACNSSPLETNTFPASVVLNGSNIEYSYTRSIPALNDNVSFTVEHSPTLAGDSWVSTGVTLRLISRNDSVQQVKAIIPMGTSPRLFVRLVVRK